MREQKQLWVPDAPHLVVVQLEHHWPDGSVKYREEVENRLFTRGVDMYLNYAARAVNEFPADWRGRLFGGAPMDSDDTASDLTGEPVGNGYAALTWTRGVVDFGALITVGGERQVRGAKKTFGPAVGADWPTVTTFVMADGAIGTSLLFARFILSAAITVLVGEDLDVRPIFVLRGVTL